MKLTYEGQFKIIFSFFNSNCQRLLEDTKALFISKCQDLYRESKSDQLSKSSIDTIVLLINSFDDLKNDSFFSTTLFSVLMNSHRKDEIEFKNMNREYTDAKQIIESENFIENFQDETVEFESILTDLGPFIINNSLLLKSDVIDLKLDEKRLAIFILFLCKHQNWLEDKENRILNKIFLKSLNNDSSKNIDENNDKKINANWNIENFYKIVKKQIDSMDVINLLFYKFTFKF